MEFGPRGRRLYEALLATDPSLEWGPMHEIAISAARAADTLECVEWQAQMSEPLIQSPRRGQQVNPKYIEARQATIALVSLLAGLRLPDIRGNRPQRHPVRGVQRIGGTK